MIKIYFSGVFIAFALGSLSAQSFLNGVNPFPDKLQSVDTIKILAVMADFQIDNDGATFGNGKFGTIYSKDYGTNILDPLPHNKEYFEAHLLFAKNYFTKVSKGKVHIEYTVLPDTVTLSKTMRNYSQPSNSTDFTPVADLSKEVWTRVDQKFPGFNFAQYNLFAIFHAGVGRDITLPGSLGNERDIPSLYLSQKSLQNIYGSSFDGFPVSNGSFKINNSMILPETESRELTSLGSTFLFEISINGLLAASIASHLGLPDLFDTKTGLSAIGRFGLMDGQAIFAYNGIFPPEPSAWEKIYLGWEQPTVIDPLPGIFNITVAAKEIASSTDASIIKIPINSSEYFLIENRIRDANADGAKITYILNGQTLTKTFPKDTSGFRSFSVDSVDGVVINVDEYDWAVPGNGIVIWHIDENVINAKLAENKINTDKNNRGVDVEEADGIQDIGEQFTTLLGDIVIGEGSSEDFWFSNNPSLLYENKFTKDSRPNSNSNANANSLINISSFSPIANRMTFRLAYGDSIVKPIFNLKFENSNNINSLIVIEDGESLRFGLLDGMNLLITNQNGIRESILDFSEFYKVASTRIDNSFYVIGGHFNKINFWIKSDSLISRGTFNIPYAISADPVIRENNSQIELIIGTTAGVILIYDLESISSVTPILKDSILVEPLAAISSISVSNNSLYAVANSISPLNPFVSYYYSSHNDKIEFANEVLTQLATTVDGRGKPVSIVLTISNKIFVISQGQIISSFELDNTSPSNLVSLGDIKHDGENYIIRSTESKIEAINLLGTSADNFPFTDPQGIGFIKTPLIADFTGDTKAEIIAATKDGRIFAIDGGTGKVVDGFPISTGGELSCTPILFVNDGKLSIAAINKKNTFAAWQIGANEGKQYWSEENGNNFNSAFVDAASRVNFVNEFFPAGKAYNYPNPVYDGSTFIRYFVTEDSKISIKIFDLAGDFVAELNDNARGGFDNETKWDVGNIQSGVYLARIEANSTSGKSESKVIKIAVVK
jgi:hypothetical protein